MTGGSFQVTIRRDRGLRDGAVKTLPRGATVADLKAQLASDDPMGSLHAEDIVLCRLDGQKLAGCEVLTSDTAELTLGQECPGAGGGEAGRPSPLRIWAVSDVHADMKENMAWVRSIAEQPAVFANDCLIVAGDVANTLKVLVEALACFKRAFRYVFFVPGNHDLWTEEGLPDSLDKLHAIEEACAEIGVLTRPAELPSGTGGAGDARPVLVVPVLSWHHMSFDTEPELDAGWGDVAPIEKCLRDYRACHWPGGLSMMDSSVAERLDQENEALWADSPLRRGGGGEDPRGGGRYAAVVSFSHFLPRIELCPEKRFLAFPTLIKAVGSRFLGARVAELRPDVHVFGHTHFGWDAEHEGVRYLQAPLSYPAERKNRAFSIAVGGWAPGAAAGSEAGDAPLEPFLVWRGGAVGGFAPRKGSCWSAFYEHYGRRPEQNRLLPFYVARRLTWTGAGDAPIGMAGQAPPMAFVGDSEELAALVDQFLSDGEARDAGKPAGKEDPASGGSCFEWLSAKDLEMRMVAGTPKVDIFDVRPVEEFERAHIPTAMSISPEEVGRIPLMQPFQRRLALLERLTDPSSTKVICGSDGRPGDEAMLKVARHLRRFGHMHAREIVLLDGGMRAWARSTRAERGSIWEVVGGADQGGILVRLGQGFASEKAGSRLATGARVREVISVGDRLLYELVSGRGPSSGWVSTRLNHKKLLVPLHEA